MTLLLAEGFDTRTMFTSGNWTPTGVGFANCAYVTGRLGGYAGRNNQVTLGQGTGFRKAVPTATTLIVGMALRHGTNYQNINWGPLELWSAGTPVFHMAISVSTFNISAYRGAASASSPTLLGTSSGRAFPTDQTTWQYVEIKVVASTGTGGSVVVRQDGLETLNVTGLNTGGASFSHLHFRWGLVNSSQYDNSCSGSFDDIYVCDATGSVNNDFLGDVRVHGLWPNGNGTNSGLVGSDGNSTDNYLLTDDASVGAPVTTDYVGSVTPGTKDTYAYTDLPAGVTVKGVQVDSYAAKGDAGVVSGRNVVFDGTNTVTGSDAVLSTSYTEVSTVMETAPDGAAWTEAKVNATQFGWEVRS